MEAIMCRCHPPSNLPSGRRRNLVVCIDGTANQFSTQNTNVVELLHRLVKSNEQLTYYNSGIGTYVKNSQSWVSLGTWKQALHHAVDMAVALTFKDKVLKAYQWLSENYEVGDRIFLFGFSRGAYQVRVIAGMIEKVGLLHKGNNEQIPFAYELYAKTISNRDPTDMVYLCKHFKETLSRPHAKVHFVGVWDTVSSIGFLKARSLPETTTGMTHVCVFRHALALHEFRLKFLPEYAHGGTGPASDPESRGNIKEVWFTGSHSDIGGGNTPNSDPNHFGPSLRWMSYEAIRHGLKMEPFKSWLQSSSRLHPSMTLLWRMLEYIPLPCLSYQDADRVVWWPPHCERPRQMQAGQLIHESVFEEIDKGRTPLVHIYGEETDWNEAGLTERGIVEKDPYIRADNILQSFKEANKVTDIDADILQSLASTELGCRSITDFPDAATILLDVLQTELMSTPRRRQNAIDALYDALDAFEISPSPSLGSSYRKLWSTLEGEKIERKFVSILGPSTPFRAIIIGIDKFKHHISRTQGSVADAKDIAAFLTEYIGVAHSQISLLLDEMATRKNIIDHILDLATDLRIAHNTPILIYYAGLTTSMDAPTAWQNSGICGQISLLQPYDSNPSDNIPGISDIILNELLSKVAAKKGNNITVILDCNQAGNFVGKGYQYAASASHVLLAACSRDGTSFEHRLSSAPTRGWFTQELTTLLRTLGPLIDKITYQDVIKRLSSKFRQSPQCRGKYDTRLLFDHRTPKPSHKFHRITKAGEAHRITKVADGQLVLEAGEPHGITIGMHFNVYHTAEVDPALLCAKVLVTEVLYFYSVVDVTERIYDTVDTDWAAWALQTDAGEDTSLRVDIESADAERDPIHHIVDIHNSSNLTIWKVLPVPANQYHELVLAVKNWMVIFNIADRTCYDFGLRCLRYSVPLAKDDRIIFVLEHAAEFFWHLRRSSELMLKKIIFEARRLSEATPLADSHLEDENIGISTLERTGDNLNVNETIHIQITEEDQIWLGFSITNAYNRSLYVWLFAFDMSELSIINMYKPNFAKNPHDADPCLPANGQLHFSNVSSGVQLDLPPEMDRNVTYLKIFLTTEYVDLSHLEKASPFNVCGMTSSQSSEFPQDVPASGMLPGASATPPLEGYTSRPLRLRGGGTRPAVLQKQKFIWYSFLIPIMVQRKNSQGGAMHETAPTERYLTLR